MIACVRSEAATLRLAVLPRFGLHADAALVLAGAGLVGVAVQVSTPLPFTPVPITGQTLAVVLRGRLAGHAARRRQPRRLPSGRAGRGASLCPARARARGPRRRQRWLPGQLRPRRSPYRLALRAALGPALLVRRRRAVDRQPRHLPRRAALARGRSGHERREDARTALYPFVAGDLLKLYLAAALLPTAWRVVGRAHR